MTTRLARSAVVVLRWCAIGFAIGLGLAVVVPLGGGFRSFTVMSGSMSPAIETGDVVVVRPIAPLQARPGDVVTFRDPDDGTRLVTHRVRAMRAEGPQVHFETRGDANNVSEHWVVTDDARIGRVTYRLPWIGRILQPAGSPLGRILLIGLSSVALGVLALSAVWRSPTRPAGRDEQGYGPDDADETRSENGARCAA